MSNEQKPGDPADKAADGAFGGVQSHRSGYGDDKLARLTEWLRAHPTATLASGEGALLLAENDRLREHMATLQADRESVSSQLWDCMYERDGWKDRAERAERILAALREPRKAVVEEAASKMHDASEPDDDCRIAWEECIPWYHITRRKMATAAIRAAVTAAEQEVGDA